jgi:DUF971 family protein
MPTDTPPRSIEIDNERGISVEWDDGTTSLLDLGTVRANCPCAECRGLRERGSIVGLSQAGATPLRINDAEFVGAWGISFAWSDGHATGIYSWELLRAWGE